MHSIAGSVGENGLNRATDVALIQVLLATLPSEAGGSNLMSWDGVYGDITKTAILRFEQVQQLVQDGIVQPNDFTIKRLAAVYARTTPQASPLDVKEWSLDGPWAYSDIGTMTGERAGSDGVGTVRSYPHYVFYYHPELGAFETHGLIGAKYWDMGGEASALGYPISDERALAGGGRVSYFQYGSITWTAPDVVTVLPAAGL